MSILIQMQQQSRTNSEQTQRFLKENLKSFFRSLHECRNVSDNGTQISFCLTGSERTYKLSTLWRFDMSKKNLLLETSLYNRDGTDFLRALSQRMKIQAYILIRIINSMDNPFLFIIDPSSGNLKVQYTIQWNQFYRIFTKQQKIQSLIWSIMMFLRKYNQLIVFFEPVQCKKQQWKNMDAKIRINKFRYIINDRKNIRNNIQACIGDLLDIKQKRRVLPRQKVSELQYFYMHNVMLFQQSEFGTSMTELNKQNLNKEMKQLQKNQSGYSSKVAAQKSKKDKDKIVMGLLRIVDQGSQNQKLYSQDGNHSLIYRNKFIYAVQQSIYSGTINYQANEWAEKVKQLRGELTYKICKNDVETSVNSFKNELGVLKYMRDSFSPYIAKYYLLIKQQWNDKDTIYMNNYKQNLYSLIKNHKGISIRTRLGIAYGICKGLCFLSSKSIAHRDLKPHNILVDSNLNPKIIDFGSCICHYNTAKFKVFDQRLLTTKFYNVQFQDLPLQSSYIKQKLSRKNYNEHPLFDIYGLGRTLSYIFFGSITPPNPQSIVHDPHCQLLGHLIYLINMCLVLDPDDRPSFAEVTAFLGAISQLTKNLIKADGNFTEEEKALIKMFNQD